MHLYQDHEIPLSSREKFKHRGKIIKSSNDPPIGWLHPFCNFQNMEGRQIHGSWLVDVEWRTTLSETLLNRPINHTALMGV